MHADAEWRKCPPTAAADADDDYAAEAKTPDQPCLRSLCQPEDHVQRVEQNVASERNDSQHPWGSGGVKARCMSAACEAEVISPLSFLNQPCTHSCVRACVRVRVRAEPLESRALCASWNTTQPDGVETAAFLRARLVRLIAARAQNVHMLDRSRHHLVVHNLHEQVRSILISWVVARYFSRRDAQSIVSTSISR